MLIRNGGSTPSKYCNTSAQPAPPPKTKRQQTKKRYSSTRILICLAEMDGIFGVFLLANIKTKTINSSVFKRLIGQMCTTIRNLLITIMRQEPELN